LGGVGLWAGRQDEGEGATVTEEHVAECLSHMTEEHVAECLSHMRAAGLLPPASKAKYDPPGSVCDYEK
jgi:hypothetical protein